MRPSTLLRTVSTKISSHFSPSSVAPWPPARSDFAIWLCSELDRLRLHPNLYSTSSWLTQCLDLAITSQQIAITAVQSSKFVKKEVVFDRMLEDDILDLLDACNAIRRRIDEIRAYTGSLDIALHWLEGEQGRRSNVSLERAKKELEYCEAIEKRCSELDSSMSSLRKLGEKIVAKGFCVGQSHGTELHEVVVGSRTVALLVISMASIALSFRTRRGIPMITKSSNNHLGNELSELQREAREEYEKRRREGVVLEELKEIVTGVQKLRSLVNGKEVGNVKEVVRELKSKCGDLDDRVKPLEEKVEGLYKGLVDVRMCLLGVISQA